MVASSVSRFNSDYTSSSDETVYGITNNTNTWYFGTMPGTSMSAPMVTGVVGLLLEGYPDLTPDQVKTLIKDNAYTDNYTGTISSSGDNTWGWGKIDAQNSLQDLENKIPNKPGITPSGTVDICQGNFITLNAPNGYSGYEWSNGANTQNIDVSNPGDYKVKVTNNQGYTSVWSDPVTVNVKPSPPKPTITQNGSDLTSSAANGYQWYRNGNIITGATQQSYHVTQTGNYSVEVTNSENCSSKSDPVYVDVTSVKENRQPKVTITPNPNNGTFYLDINDNYEVKEISIIDVTGREIYKSKSLKKNINLPNISKGLYFININFENNFYLQRKIIVN